MKVGVSEDVGVNEGVYVDVSVVVKEGVKVSVGLGVQVQLSALAVSATAVIANFCSALGPQAASPTLAEISSMYKERMFGIFRMAGNCSNESFSRRCWDPWKRIYAMELWINAARFSLSNLMDGIWIYIICPAS